jgi:hypothetical protein
VPEHPPEFGDEAVNLIGCDHCGRKFNEKAHAKHIKVCAIVGSKQPKKQFNAKANRVVDSEQESLAKMGERVPYKKKDKYGEDRVQCPHCMRKFGEV